MSRRQKLIARITARPATARYSDVVKVLELYGWSRRNQAGSHVTFGKPGHPPIGVVVHDEKVKRVYLDRICDILGLDYADED